jgi:hypothetical protein
MNGLKPGLALTMLVAVALLLLLAPGAFSQDSVVTLNYGDDGVHQRPPVRFPHEAHAGKFDCVRCHHDFDSRLNNRGGEDSARPCTNCHGNAAGRRPIPALTDAFHEQCKQCHEALRGRELKSGPVMCGECHVRD